MEQVQVVAGQGLKYLAQWPPVHLTFEDVVSTVTDDNGKNKVILSGVSGCFKSGHLTAILGGSGAGKTTLLNSLAGFKCQNVTGNIAVNGKERNVKTFRHISRYIMQQDTVQSMLTVQEVMCYAADLKLGFNETTKAQKDEIIEEVLMLLRLNSVAHTSCLLLSGGELKRLSIALELVNNPPVLFLDEPTTGLDDYSGLKCIELLRNIAYGGRTVVCSIHTPSARMFEMFDHVYVVAKGKCAYQGKGQNIVQFVREINIACPRHYNPADFIVELASGEYGDNYIEQMIAKIENGRVFRWTTLIENSNKIINCDSINLDINLTLLKSKCTSWQQFAILFKRESTKIYRNRTNVIMQICMHIFIGLVIGGMFWQFGNDPTKTIFNFGFCFTVVIAFLYIPMMPVLCFFPTQIQALKREYFNCWYELNPYYCAVNLARAPLQLANGLLYLTMVYFLTDQPLEFKRISLFYIISLLVSLTSESLGILVSSSLSIINSTFLGPCVAVPLMLLSVYGVGVAKESVPLIIRFLMSLSYMRHGMEGIVQAIYGYNRAPMKCPAEETLCLLRDPEIIFRLFGFEEVNILIPIIVLIGFCIIFNICALILIRRRLSTKRQTFWIVQFVSRFVKNYFNFESYKL